MLPSFSSTCTTWCVFFSSQCANWLSSRPLVTCLFLSTAWPPNAQLASLSANVQALLPPLSILISRRALRARVSLLLLAATWFRRRRRALVCSSTRPLARSPLAVAAAHKQNRCARKANRSDATRRRRGRRRRRFNWADNSRAVTSLACGVCVQVVSVRAASASLIEFCRVADLRRRRRNSKRRRAARSVRAAQSSAERVLDCAQLRAERPTRQQNCARVQSGAQLLLLLRSLSPPRKASFSTLPSPAAPFAVAAAGPATGCRDCARTCPSGAGGERKAISNPLVSLASAGAPPSSSSSSTSSQGSSGGGSLVSAASLRRSRRIGRATSRLVARPAAAADCCNYRARRRRHRLGLEASA